MDEYDNHVVQTVEKYVSSMRIVMKDMYVIQEYVNRSVVLSLLM